ncbi:FecR family protein [Pedobacter nyackensis]|uniref:FecR family protein n=1 Tax=Pedobacter nyackensis TaxID=475255 RepID=A0A1W2ANI2_9SPHI|nr:FecR family protein [Pedobacter nyackensis]SMC62256.1 FecR family protein [Pedobacter nyackensis]
MQEERINELIAAYLEGRCTPEEKGLIEGHFIRYLDNSSYRPSVSQLETSFKRTYNNIVEEIKKEPVKQQTTKRLYLKWIGYAAAVFFTIGLSTFLSIHFKGNTLNQSAKQVSVEPPIGPGQERATLTLSNGKEIVLDRRSKGEVLADQGLEIIKGNDGQLVYKVIDGQVSAIGENTLSTNKGETYAVVLLDGTKVWLNASSSLTYNTAFFKEGKRSVKLKGEGYFEVAKDKHRPFIVEVNQTVVKVFGTHFNIHAYEDESVMKATLLEGSIGMSKGTESSLLSPGEEASVRKNSTKITVKKSINLSEAIAWKNGYFQFDNADVQSVMRQLARWYDINVVYQGEIPTVKFKGKIQRNLDLSYILEYLKNDIHYERNGNTIIIKP